MPVHRLLPAVILLVSLGLPAMAADASRRESCLSKAEQRAAVAANRAISLSEAIKSLRQHKKYSEVVRARLCWKDEKLVYVLILLGRSGKVSSVTVDAMTGEYHTGR